MQTRWPISAVRNRARAAAGRSVLGISHARVGRAAATLRHDPIDVLRRALDVAPAPFGHCDWREE
eukprot:6214084-Pleurochrysis_carterae.AAC.1